VVKHLKNLIFVHLSVLASRYNQVLALALALAHKMATLSQKRVYDRRTDGGGRAVMDEQRRWRRRSESDARVCKH
jgi:hypothetical protein